MKTALLFAGQGSQSVGMGLDLYNNFPIARQTFQEIDDFLGRHLTHLMFEGDITALTLTQNAQPAIMAVGMAVVRVLETELGHPLPANFAAGHSLGEYTALCAAGALSLETTTRLLEKRSLAMAKAAETVKGGMAAVLGLSLEQVFDLIQTVSTKEVPLYPANDNCEGQIIVSGSIQAIEKLIPLAEKAGAKRVIPLAVSGAFHCPFMQSAQDEMAPIILGATVNSPKIPVISNVQAMPETNPDDIRQNLITQITAPVRWRESVLYLKDQGINTYIECGNGKVMAGLIRRIDPTATVLSVSDKGTIDQALSLIGQ